MGKIDIRERLKVSFSARILLIVFLVITLMTFSFTVIAIKSERREHINGLVKKGELFSMLLADNSRLGLFSENESLLKEPAEGILRQEDVQAVEVFTLDGTILKGLHKASEKRLAESPVTDEVGASVAIERLKKTKIPHYLEAQKVFDFWAPVLSGAGYASDSTLSGELLRQQRGRVIGFVRVMIDKSALNKEIIALLKRNIIIGLFFLFISFFIAYHILRNITRPLNRLTSVVEAFGSEGVAEKIPIETSDEIGKLAAAFNDMTEALKKREAEMIALNINLKREVEEKTALQREAIRAAQLVSLGELAAGVAHEINNPINSIINYAQLLIDEHSTADAVYANRIIREGDRISRIVKSLLSFARDRKEAKSPVSIINAIKESLNLVGTQLKKDGINLILELPDTLPDVTAHMYQLEQVFLNILSNARHALNQKYPSADEDKLIRISGEEVVIDERTYVRIVFYDQGAGIPADMLDKVMNPFFTTKPQGIGTGLGLSVSYGIISDHGGKLTIQSVEGSYTKVIIKLSASA